jgi:hypothetical protein
MSFGFGAELVAGDAVITVRCPVDGMSHDTPAKVLEMELGTIDLYRSTGA